MNLMVVLEGIYYLVTILISVGFLRNLFNTLTISNSLEIIFIRNPQRFILKLWFFIKYYFDCIYVCVFLVYVINSFKIGFSLADFFTYSALLFFCDYVYLSLFENTILLKLYSNLVKRMTDDARNSLLLLLSILLTIISHYLGKIIDNRIISISQFICLFAFIRICNNARNIKIKGKNYKIDFINVAIFLTPLFIKTLLIFNNNTIFNIKFKSLINNLELSDIVSYIYEICNSEDSINVLIIFSVFSVLIAIFCVKRDFNLHSFLICKNKTWKIVNITIDKYAICYCDNCAFMIKIDDIKNNYFCKYSEGNFYFRKKEDMNEIKITENCIKGDR